MAGPDSYIQPALAPCLGVESHEYWGLGQGGSCGLGVLGPAKGA